MLQADKTLQYCLTNFYFFLQNGHAVDNTGLNVGDPRYSARYGNPYLRTLAATSAIQPDNTTTFASMSNHGGGGNRAYSTLNPGARHKACGFRKTHCSNFFERASRFRECASRIPTF